MENITHVVFYEVKRVVDKCLTRPKQMLSIDKKWYCEEVEFNKSKESAETIKN
jgi:hypothetical protein